MIKLVFATIEVVTNVNFLSPINARKMPYFLMENLAESMTLRTIFLALLTILFFPIIFILKKLGTDEKKIHIVVFQAKDHCSKLKVSMSGCWDIQPVDYWYRYIYDNNVITVQESMEGNPVRKSGDGR